MFVYRDHVLARRYFDRAANMGDLNAMCHAAGMYLKGEGGQGNATRARELYEEAAKANHVRYGRLGGEGGKSSRMARTSLG